MFFRIKYTINWFKLKLKRILGLLSNICGKMDKSDDKKPSFDESINLKHENSSHVSQICLERAFKRLKVDENDDSNPPPTNSHSSLHSHSSSPKSLTHSPRKRY